LALLPAENDDYDLERRITIVSWHFFDDIRILRSLIYNGDGLVIWRAEWTECRRVYAMLHATISDKRCSSRSVH